MQLHAKFVKYHATNHEIAPVNCTCTSESKGHIKTREVFREDIPRAAYVNSDRVTAVDVAIQ